ncbi:CYFA0S06e00254g1_1 [Cyberlindnera fabianii]|uniref:CYFA0S06e00254g1_1 n=1 Tax=Cyberlindnera fabianii TaxID=36022 RepID=A0A061ATT1_CYBFA|nr:CYFA0S06e00254g1_1 [Cyberlindnera fabianii]
MRTAVVTLALSLIVTGCLNSIFTKYQDNQYVAPDRKFEQPVLQTLQMFIGEAAAFLFVLARKYNGNASSSSDYTQLPGSGKPQLPRAKSYLLAIPAFCDLLGTTLMNLGLMYSPVSIYQMTRGALIIFVALFSITFLKRTISRVEWFALLLVVTGITIVGLSGKSNAGAEGVTEAHPKVFLGILLILLAQVFTATQFVVEEHIVNRWTVEPLSLVGYEGTFGGLLTFLGMLVGWITFAHGTKGPFDLVNSWNDFISNETIIWSSFAIMCSIGLFNFIGITLTSVLSATARSTIDTCRTLLVWIISLWLGWESFVFLQLVGFCFLVFGTLLFNGAINIDKYLPSWLTADKSTVRIIDVVDEQIERQ